MFKKDGAVLRTFLGDFAIAPDFSAFLRRQSFLALLILGMNWELYDLKLRSSSYCYSAPPLFSGST